MSEKKQVMAESVERIDEGADPKEGMVEVGVGIRLWCDLHEKQAKGFNQTYMVNAMFSRLTDNAVAESMETKPNGELEAQDIAQAFRAVAEMEKPLCCLLGQEALDEILADAPVSSGDDGQDMADAAYAVPGVEPYRGDKFRLKDEEEALGKRKK